MSTDEELMPTDEETDENGNEKPSWSERRKARKQSRTTAKTEQLKRQIEETHARNELLKQRQQLRQEKAELQAPQLKRATAFGRVLAEESARSFGKTAKYMRDRGRQQARRSAKRGIRRVQRIPAVAQRSPVVSQHSAVQPTGMEQGIMMEFQKPPRQDMFVGGQGNIVEHGTQQVNIVERGSQPTVQQAPVIRTTRPVMVQQPQVQQQQMDFFGPSKNQDFFGNSNKDFFGPSKDILGSKKKKQNYF